MTNHSSDCALHNGPANIPDSCDCGFDPLMTPEKYGSEYPQGWHPVASVPKYTKVWLWNGAIMKHCYADDINTMGGIIGVTHWHFAKLPLPPVNDSKGGKS